MREIKFRGKRLDSGEWVYGDLIHDCNGNAFINIEGYSARGMGVHYKHLVIPETVGQFTGRLDEHGRKIYEGDILDYDSRQVSDLNVVSFEDGSFMLTGKDGLRFYPYGSEIVGNIHDNPELLNNLTHEKEM